MIWKVINKISHCIFAVYAFGIVAYQDRSKKRKRGSSQVAKTPRRTTENNDTESDTLN